MRKVTIEAARTLFASRGCRLTSDSINNVRESLSFVCVCGRSAQISYDKFRRGQLCGGCRWERGSSKQRRTIDSVRETFALGGCELLSSEYSSNKQKLSFRCSCGNVTAISLAKFQAGQRCQSCKDRRISEKLTGPNNPSWKPELTEADRVKERTIPGYDEWRRSVFRRDGYICVICGHGGRLNAHHIESYARVPEKRTDVTNGVTLCEDCHNEYHRKVSHNDADMESFEYFLTDYREPR
ncbi:HNH endonuclease [Paenibacillus sp. BK033]|nr:HNH endonuclease [Paenibacillus sp. BK033]